MQRKQGFRESFKDYMIDMQTMVRPLNYSSKDTLRIIKENCTPSLRIFLRAYKVSDLDTPMILADEYEELEKEREAFTQDQVGITNVEYTSGAANAANRREMASDLSRREASGGRNLSKLTGNLIEEEQQLSPSVTIGGGTFKAAIDTGATASFISKELGATWLPSGRLR